MRKLVVPAEGEVYPQKLNKDEIANPYSVIHSFFDCTDLEQTRNNLWTWLETTVTGTFPKGLTRRERCNILFQYQQLEKLLEAVFILYMEEQNRMRGKKLKDKNDWQGIM
jgi:hypothetical protein